MKEVCLRKTTLAISLCLILILNFLSGCSQNNFTGTFLADSRPHQILLLTLIQTKDTVSGSLIIAKPSGNGNTHSDTFPLRGITDGNVITLTADRLFEDLVINGKKEGRNLVLMLPVDSGNISKLTLKPTTENDYNVLLNQWQAEFAEINTEKEKLTQLDKQLLNDTNAIKTAEIQGEMTNIKSALAHEQSALHELESNLAKLIDDASIRPMTCYQANQVVKYNFEQIIGYNYHQNFQYANNLFQTALHRMEEQLSKVESMTVKIKKSREQFVQAIQTSKFPLPKFLSQPGQDISALEQYQSIATQSRNELPSLKSENDMALKKANSIMEEGKLVMEKAQNLASCH